MKLSWCDVCRGGDDLFSCGSCSKKFHIEYVPEPTCRNPLPRSSHREQCVKLRERPPKDWQCDDCTQDPDDSASAEDAAAAKKAKRATA
eukprot:6745445-Pyramimonas_sp.AAC.1